MEIHSHGKNLNPHLPLNSEANTAAELKAGNEIRQAEKVKPQNLAKRLRGGTEVRERLLFEIQAKVHVGEYQTREAAVRAAQQIVGR